MQIIRYQSSSGTTALGFLHNSQFIGYFQPGVELHQLLHLRADELRTHIENSIQPGLTPNAAPALLAPIDGETEVWAAGVTYKRSEKARMEESGTPVVSATRMRTCQRILPASVPPTMMPYTCRLPPMPSSKGCRLR